MTDEKIEDISGGQFSNGRPTPSKIVQVVEGLGNYTPEQQAYVDSHPEIQKHQESLAKALKKSRNSGKDGRGI